MNAQIEHAFNLLQSGPPEVPEEALSCLRSLVYSFGMKVCGDREDAEDTTQETLIRLAGKARQFPDARALAVWLYKVAKSQCLMSRRQSKFAPRQMLSLEDLMPNQREGEGVPFKPWPVTPEDALLQKEFRKRLEQAVLSLPRPYRMVLILRDMEQLSTREVAEVLGISTDTVKMRLHRARIRVRNVLDEYFRSTQADGEPNGRAKHG